MTTSLILCVLCADPPVVTHLQAERINSSQIMMSWERPKTNDVPVTHYTIKYYPLIPDNHMQDSVVRYLTTNETEVVVKYLDPSLSYSISVAANNGAGRGNYSEIMMMECKCPSEYCSAFCKTFPEPDKSTSSPFLQGTSTPTIESSYPVATYAAFATVVVVVLVLSLVLVVCILTMAVWRKKTHSRHLRYM